jgi:polyphosphate kinase
MHRNLDRRVEVLVQLKELDHVGELREMFDLALDEGTSSWWLQPDDTWQARLTGPDGASLVDLQERLIATRGRRRTADPIT